MSGRGLSQNSRDDIIGWIKSSILSTSGSSAVDWLAACLSRPIDVDLGRVRQILAWADGTISTDQGHVLVAWMVHDILLFLWALRLLDCPRFRAKHAVGGLIEQCHDFLLGLSRSPTFDVGVIRAITDRQQEMLFLTMLMVDPTVKIRQYFEVQLREDKAFRIQVRVVTEKMLHTSSRLAADERLRVRLRLVKSISAQFDRDTDTRSQTQPPDSSQQQAATRATTSPEPRRRNDPSVGRRMASGSSTAAATAAEEAQLTRLSLQQADPSPPSYQKGDLIDLVANRKASPNQLQSFKSQLLNSETFYQQASDRLDIYSSHSEEEKRKKLRALLESVRKQRTNTAAAGSGQQPKEEEVANQKSKESPTKKEPATTLPPSSSATVASLNPSRTMTREEKLANQYRKDTIIHRKFCEELENATPILSLNQVSEEVQRAIRNHHIPMASQCEAVKRGFLRAAPTEGNPPRDIVEVIKACEDLYHAQARFSELKLLASASGSAAKEAAEKISTKLTKASMAASEAQASSEAHSASQAGPSTTTARAASASTSPPRREPRIERLGSSPSVPPAASSSSLPNRAARRS